MPVLFEYSLGTLSQSSTAESLIQGVSVTLPDAGQLDTSWPIAGHRWAVRFLELSIVRDRVSHAYLFTGPAQVGKTTLALSFAKALNCSSNTTLSPAGQPCGECPSCIQIQRGCHPDVRVIGLGDQAALLNRDPAKQKEIGIDTVREFFVQTAAQRPLEGNWKVYILQNAEKLSEEAANAFLKTLEDGSAFNVMILLADDDSGIAPTVLSRCQRITLRPVAAPVITSLLISQGLDEAKAELLASLSQGRVGWAVMAARDPNVLEQREEETARASSVVGYGPTERIAVAEKLSRSFAAGKREQVFDSLDTLVGWWRDLLLFKTGCDDLAVNVDRKDVLARQSASLDLPDIRYSILAVAEAAAELDLNVNARLALENMLMRLPFAEA